MGLATRIAGGLGGAIAASVAGLVLYSGLNARRARRLVPVEGRFVDVEGARLHYVEMGSGPALVMVHGLSCDLHSLTYALAEPLSRDFRVIVVDRPGCGYSTMTKDAVETLHGQAAIIARFIRAVGAEGALLVGHSLGGAVSLCVASDEPGLVGGLALVAPLTQPITELSRAFRPLVIPSPIKRRIISWTLAAPLAKYNRRKTLRLIFGPEPVVDDFEGRGGAALSLTPSAIFTAASEVSLGTGELVDLVRGYPALRLPVGILYGKSDRILAHELHGAPTASLIPGAELELIEGGHMIPLTVPAIVTDFVRRQAARVFDQGTSPLSTIAP